MALNLQLGYRLDRLDGWVLSLSNTARRASAIPFAGYKNYQKKKYGKLLIIRRKIPCLIGNQNWHKCEIVFIQIWQLKKISSVVKGRVKEEMAHI